MDIAKLVDHTILKADATAKEVERLCKEANLKVNFMAGCFWKK